VAAFLSPISRNLHREHTTGAVLEDDFRRKKMEIYSIDGSIPVGNVDMAVLFAAMDNILEEKDIVVNNLEYRGEGMDFMLSVSDEMSFTEAEELDQAIGEFAKQYATGPAVLDVEYGGVAQKLYVGPAGFDASESEALDISTGIAEAIKRRRLVLNPDEGMTFKPPFVMSKYAKKAHLETDRRLYGVAEVTEKRQLVTVLAALSLFSRGHITEDIIAEANADGMTMLDLNEIEFLVDGLRDGSIRLVGGLKAAS